MAGREPHPSAIIGNIRIPLTLPGEIRTAACAVGAYGVRAMAEPDLIPDVLCVGLTGEDRARQKMSIARTVTNLSVTLDGCSRGAMYAPLTPEDPRKTFTNQVLIGTALKEAEAGKGGAVRAEAARKITSKPGTKIKAEIAEVMLGAARPKRSVRTKLAASVLSAIK